MYPKEIETMSTRLNTQPDKLISKTLTDVRVYKYALAAIWMICLLSFYFMLGLFQASTTITLDIIYGIMMVFCWACPITLTTIVFYVVVESMFHPEELAIDMLVEEEKEYNETLDRLWNRHEN